MALSWLTLLIPLLTVAFNDPQTFSKTFEFSVTIQYNRTPLIQQVQGHNSGVVVTAWLNLKKKKTSLRTEKSCGTARLCQDVAWERYFPHTHTCLD